VRNLYGAVVAVASCSAAWATPYYVEYLGSSGDFPEAEGWTRIIYGGGAQRWFEEDSLVLDSRASTDIEEAYVMERPGQVDPSAPGEWFFMSWRLRIDELQGLWDPGVAVFSDDRRAVFLDFEWGGVLDPWAGHVVATFEPGVFHDFELQSADMLTYNLFIDSTLSYIGTFTDPLIDSSRVIWGDVTSGGASLALWQRFSFGVVPEPTSALAGVTLLAVARAAGRGKSR
jgi:hypothetical protein